VVIVSSLLHERGVVDFDDLNLTKTFEAIKNGDRSVIKKAGRHNPGYCNTKLMNVYFGRGLANRTKDFGVDVFSVCPGFTYTNLFRYTLRWYHYILMAPIFLFYLRTPSEVIWTLIIALFKYLTYQYFQGVQTILYCALDPLLQGKSGGFYRNCVPYHSKVMFDKEIEDKLWNVSEEMVESKLKLK